MCQDEVDKAIGHLNEFKFEDLVKKINDPDKKDLLEKSM